MVYRMKIFYSFSRICRKWIERIKGTGRKSASPTISGHEEVTHFLSLHLQTFARRYEGKLLLQEEIALPQETFDKLVTLQQFTPIPTIMTNPFYSQCVRCYNRQASQFATIPCLRCGKTHLYCRKCIEMGRVLSCESLYYWTGEAYQWPKHNNPCSWSGELTTAQSHAAKRITQAITRQKRLLVWAVTGAGKTEMLFPGISFGLKQGMRICIASPRADVVRELLPRLQAAFQSTPIQGLYSGSRDKDGTAQILICTTHQLFRYQKAFDILIIDEIDAFPFHQDATLQVAAKRAAKEKAATILLTATPKEKQRLQIIGKRMEYIFVPTRFHGHPLITPKWLQINALQKNLQNGCLPIKFQQWLQTRRSTQRQLLIFIPTIQLLHTLHHPIYQYLLQEKQLLSLNEIDHVHAEDPERKEKVLAFRDKSIKVLLTTTILERGVTFPAVDVVVLHAGHSIFDEAALVQIAGRAGRSPLDPDGEVVFFHDGKTDAMVRTNQSIKEMNRYCT